MRLLTRIWILAAIVWLFGLGLCSMQAFTSNIIPRNRSQMLKLNSQIANWDLPGPVQAITYDQLGNVFMGF